MKIVFDQVSIAAIESNKIVLTQVDQMMLNSSTAIYGMVTYKLRLSDIFAWGFANWSQWQKHISPHQINKQMLSTNSL